MSLSSDLTVHFYEILFFKPLLNLVHKEIINHSQLQTRYKQNKKDNFQFVPPVVLKSAV